MLNESKFNYYLPGHGSEFPSEKYASEKTGKMLNQIYFGSNVILASNVIDYLFENGFTLINEKRNYTDPSFFTTSDVYERYFPETNDCILIGISNRLDDSGLYDDDIMIRRIGKPKKSQYKGWIQTTTSVSFVFDLLPKLNKFMKKDLKGKIHLLKATSYGFETEAFDLTKPTIKELDLNYGSGFSTIHKNIVETINGKNDNNAKLVLLHGDPGTGKTTYIKYLAHELGKKVLFLPPFMAESIVNPDFVPFLMENKDCVLIIEDAEKVIGDRQSSGSSVGVSNLLNLSDGILGDILNINIIATFNMSKERIDKALLRKGRLIAEHRFGPLSVEDTNKLLKEIGKDTNSEKELTLAEIYNVDKKQDKTEEVRQTIGFNRY